MHLRHLYILIFASTNIALFGGHQGRQKSGAGKTQRNIEQIGRNHSTPARICHHVPARLNTSGPSFIFDPDSDIDSASGPDSGPNPYRAGVVQLISEKGDKKHFDYGGQQVQPPLNYSRGKVVCIALSALAVGVLVVKVYRLLKK